MSSSSEIIVGVVAGLLASAVLAGVKSAFFGLLVPWYRATTYKGIVISGAWHRLSKAQSTLVEIEQSCERLKGKATVTNLHHDKKVELDDIRTFDIQGYVQERFVILNLKCTDRSRLGVVTFLLQIMGDGTQLSGASSWYAPLMSEVNCGLVNFFREPKRAKEECDLSDSGR